MVFIWHCTYLKNVFLNYKKLKIKHLRIYRAILNLLIVYFNFSDYKYIFSNNKNKTQYSLVFGRSINKTGNEK